jgi:hypothetical protein
MMIKASTKKTAPVLLDPPFITIAVAEMKLNDLKGIAFYSHQEDFRRCRNHYWIRS